tara:strand:+ start:1388 stop:2431 length:1044 start_codon:yes stop_codon:yes gene_type:complete
MAYTTIDKPTDYFNTVLYSGTGSELAITGVGHQPDWVWIKERNGATNQMLTDSVRGATKTLHSQNNDQESTDAQALKSFNSDGFTVGTDGDVNTGSDTYVSWNWKAGTSFTNDVSSTSIGDIDSSGSVSQTSGFSICSYAGSGSSGDTIKHGLSTAPKIIIIKKRSAGDNWTMLNTNIDLNTHLHLNTTQAAVSDPMFTNTAPTTSVFTVDSDGQVNESGHTFIAYCFSEVKGYSKFGSYTGNGNADGPFVYMGFKPAMIIYKRTSDGTNNWSIFDNKRDPFNEIDAQLNPNISDAEGTSSRGDFVSNGWKVSTSSGSVNNSGTTYIFMAFAENPFVTSTGVPTTAR